MMMNIKKVFFLAVLLFASADAFSQRWNWPEDRAKAEEKMALYTDELKLEQYRKSANDLHWLLLNAPDLNVSLYQNGSRIYERLAEKEDDPALKQLYLDSLMWMYDTRLRYFNDSVNVMNRKSFKAYKHYIKDKDKYEFLLKLYDETFRISGNNVLDSNLPAYMHVVKNNRLIIKNLSIEDVFDRYNRISMVLDYKIRNGKNLERQKDMIDRILTETVPEGIDCNFVIENLGPRFREDPEDLALAKRIFSFMLKGKCTEDPLFMDVAREIQLQEPNYGRAYKVIGKKCLKQKNYSCAESYFTEALSLAPTGAEKADVYIDLGKMKSFQDDKVEAREYYKKALQADPGNKTAFESIGNLYYYNVADCAEKKDKVKDRLPYIAAYDMYKKAGNTKMMNGAQERFPSKEEIFIMNYTDGQKMDIDCWINVSVTLQTRD